MSDKPIIWRTPMRIFTPLDREFGFTVDLCADRDNAKLPKFLLTEDSLRTSWQGEGPAFLNPPYGRGIEDWTFNALYESEIGRVIVAVLPGRTNPPWWHDHVLKAAEIRFIRHKQSFDGDGCNGVPPWGVAVVVWYPTAAKNWLTREDLYQTKHFPIVTSWAIETTS